jgi:hypothetical protein
MSFDVFEIFLGGLFDHRPNYKNTETVSFIAEVTRFLLFGSLNIL